MNLAMSSIETTSHKALDYLNIIFIGGSRTDQVPFPKF